MNYEEFLANVCRGMRELIGEEDMQDKTVSLQKVIKNNDVELDALVITSKEHNMSPTIYLNHYYDDITAGRDFDDIIDEIFGLYCRHSDNLQFDIEQFREFEKIQDKIVYKIVNANNNKKSLKSIPHIKVLDFAIIFMCLLEDGNIGDATVTIHKDHIAMWNITVNRLYKTAKRNMPRLLPAEIKNMDEIVKKLIVDDIQRDIDSSDDLRESFENEYGSVDQVADDIMDNINEMRHEMKMFVLTNTKKMFGAACILYENVLREFAEEVKNDLYILPSSVHEVILVPADSDIRKSSLDIMVKRVNREELEVCDILSDHAYIYTRDDNKIHM